MRLALEYAYLRPERSGYITFTVTARRARFDGPQGRCQRLFGPLDSLQFDQGDDRGTRLGGRRRSRRFVWLTLSIANFKSHKIALPAVPGLIYVWRSAFPENIPLPTRCCVQRFETVTGAPAMLSNSFRLWLQERRPGFSAVEAGRDNCRFISDRKRRAPRPADDSYSTKSSLARPGDWSLW